MIRPILAAGAVFAAATVKMPTAVATQQNVCTDPQIECSSGPQLCATVVLFDYDFYWIKTSVAVNCYQGA